MLQGIIPDGFFDGSILPKVGGDNKLAGQKIIFDVKTLADGPTYMQTYNSMANGNMQRR